MIQRVAHHDNVTDEVAARIAEAIRPWRIVLFGSRARGDAHEESDYDLLIEIDPSATSRIEIERQIMELFLRRDFRIDFKLRQPGEIERRRDDPGALEWDVAREGRVLYADPGAPTNLMRVDRVGESLVDPPESVREWLDNAQRDLRMCRLHVELADDSWDYVCFWAQQTAEKHMKALLVSRRVRPDRTHDVTGLLATLRSAGCELPAADADCSLLGKYAVAPRYPRGPDLDEEHGRAALAAAERIVSAVNDLLPRQIH
jgi:HEPN domain-containing protein/predicted nucleotidyltransferase